MQRRNQGITGPIRHRRRKYMVALTVLVIPSVIFVVVIRRAVDSERIRSLVVARIQDFVRADIDIGHVKFSWFDGLRFSRVVVRTLSDSSNHDLGLDVDREIGVQGSSGVRLGRPWFSCPRIDVVPRWWSLLYGRFEIEAIFASAPVIDIVRDLHTGDTNVFGVFRPATHAGSGWTSPPTLEFRSARMRVAKRINGSEVLLDDVTLDVRGRRSSTQPDRYDVVWQRGDDWEAHGWSQLDLRTGKFENVKGGLPWVSLDGAMIALDAGYGEAGTWADLLGLEGAVRVSDYKIPSVGDGRGSSEVGRDGAADFGRAWGVVELNGATLSIPLTGTDPPFPPEERFLRLNEVGGTLKLTGDKLSMNLTGRLRESQLRVMGEMSGRVGSPASLDDVDMDVSIEADSLQLPRLTPGGSPSERLFVRRWVQLEKFYSEFEPNGTVNAAMTVVKQRGAGKPVRVKRLQVEPVDVQFRYHKFPYPLQATSGDVEFSPRGVAVRGLGGRHGTGTFRADGWVGRKKVDPTADLRICGMQIPIDAELCDAVEGRTGPVCSTLHLTGSANIEVDLVRSAGNLMEEPIWLVRAEVAPIDVAFRPDFFPYTIELDQGAARLEDHFVRVDGLSGQAGDGRIAFLGDIWPRTGRDPGIDLQVNAEGMKWNEVLEAALPETVSRGLDGARLTGRFDAQVALQRVDADEAVSSSIRWQPGDMTVDLPGFSAPLRFVRGDVEQTPDGQWVIRGGRGRLIDSEVNFSGRWPSQVDTEKTRSVSAAQVRDLRVEARGLVLGDALLDAVPPRWSDQLRDWKVESPIDVRVDLRGPESPETPDVFSSLMIRLDHATVGHRFLPFPLTDVSGAVRIEGGVVDVENLGGVMLGGQIEVRGRVPLNEMGGTEPLSVMVRNLRIGDELAPMIPSGFRDAWNRLNLDGVVDVSLMLLADRRDSCGPVDWLGSADINISGASMRGWAPIQDAEGMVAVQGCFRDTRGQAVLDGTLVLDQLDVWGRSVTGLRAPFSWVMAEDGSQRLVLPELSASMYGGLLTGSLELKAGPLATDYVLSMMGRGVDVHRLVNADRGAMEEDVVVTGDLNARLQLAGSLGVVDSRRGLGRVEIVDGELYRVPVVLAILQVLNLTVPTEGAFQDAEVRYFISGNRIELQEISLRGNSIALAGSGTVSLPDTGLDLNLVSVNPRSWTRLPGLTSFVEGASREIVGLRVTGPLHRPTVRAQPLPGVSDEFRRIFQRRKTPQSASTIP